MVVNLIFFSKNGRRKDISLGEGVTIIGRRPDCDIRIPLLYVSRKHCRFIRKEDQTIVQDLGSANGTYLNSERIMEAVVNPGDKVGVGSVTFTVQVDGQPADLGQPAPAPVTQETPDFDSEQASPAPTQDEIPEGIPAEEIPNFDASGSDTDPLSDFDIDQILDDEEQK